jgi:hypothetical protein
MNLITKNKSRRLDKLVDMHSSLVAGNPSIVFFTNSVHSAAGIICPMIYLSGFVIAAYQNFLPVIVNTKIVWSEDKVHDVSLKTMNLKAGSFSLNPGGFRTVYYFAKLPIFKQYFFGMELEDGTVPLCGRIPEFRESVKNIAYTSNLPILVFSVSNWSYNIIPITSRLTPLVDIYDNTYRLKSTEYSSILTFDNSSILNCLTNTNSPIVSCNVQDTVGFTIVQKLPSFTGQAPYDSSWTTDVFHIPLLNKKLGDFSKPAYVFKGKLVFTRKNVAFKRVNGGSTTFLDSSTVGTFPSPSQETLFQNIKIGCLIQLFKQFNTLNPTDDYVWSQTKDFEMTINGIANLLPEYKDYNTSSFVGEFIDRITTVTKFWAATSSNSDASPIVFQMIRGEAVERILSWLSFNFWISSSIHMGSSCINDLIGRLFLALSVQLLIKESDKRRANSSK